MNTKTGKHYYFVGIGGIGMGALAVLLLARGEKVSGSDINENKMVKALRSKGADIYIGHHFENLKNVDAVIYSSAIKSENPEIKYAIDKGLKIYQRAELLAELMDNHFAITVAGAHGKTTTTSMIAHLLKECGVHPTCAIGGLLTTADTNAYLGGGKYFVAEADESDGSFLNYTPKISVITNIDLEHLDHYNGWEEITETYTQFINNTDVSGHILYCGDDARLTSLVQNHFHTHQSYGFNKTNNLYAKLDAQNGFNSCFTCYYQNQKIGKITLPVPGRHNILNALAAILTGLTLCLSFEEIEQALCTFQGVQRRFQKKGEVNHIIVIDDYAHHPTELQVTLNAAKKIGHKRLVAIFQPHRYSRFLGLFDDFVTAFQDVDHLVVTDVYAAGEKSENNTHIEKFIKKLKENGLSSVEYKKKEDIAAYIQHFGEPYDVILTLGAGDITYISDDIVNVLSNVSQKTIGSRE